MLGSLNVAQCFDAVGQPARNDAGVVGEFVGDVAMKPAALILWRLRPIPMIETQPRRDPSGDQFVDQSIVKIEATLFDRALAARLDARPGGRKPVGLEAAARDQIDIFAVSDDATVARDVPGIRRSSPFRTSGNRYPQNAFAAAVFVGGAPSI